MIITPGTQLHVCRSCPGTRRIPVAAAQHPRVAAMVKLLIRCPDCDELASGDYDTLTAQQFMNQHEMRGALTDWLESGQELTPEAIINAGRTE